MVREKRRIEVKKKVEKDFSPSLTLSHPFPARREENAWPIQLLLITRVPGKRGIR